MNNTPFMIERTFNAPAETVWKALTDKADMKQWYFDVPEFRPEVGCEFSFSAGPPNKEYLHLCKVTDVIPGKKITYSWRYDGYEGNSFVSFELFAEGEKTRLTLTHEGLETFPASNPDFVATNFEMGWTGFFDKALKGFLEKAVA